MQLVVVAAPVFCTPRTIIQLCVLADRYLIQDLQVRCLTNLYKILVDIKLNSTTIGLVLDLLRYVYSEGEVQQAPALKWMVLLYVAAQFHDVSKDARLRVMIQDLRELRVDFVYEFFESGG